MWSVKFMKNKRNLFFKLFLPLLLLITACSSRDSSENIAHMDMATEDRSAEQYMAEEDSAEQADGELGIDLGEKIIENASLSYETTNFDEAIAFVNEQISEHSGQLEHSSRSSNSTYSDSGEFISMTIRLPQDQLDVFIDRLKNYDQLYLQSQEIGRSDVTKSYRDNETRIAVLKEEETALREMLKEQGSLEEVLQIRTRLSEIITEREIYEDENKNYDEQIEFSTIYLSIQQTDRASDRDLSGFWNRLVNALGDSFYSFIRVMQQLAINIVYLFPYLIILVIVLILVYFIWRKIRK